MYGMVCMDVCTYSGYLLEVGTYISLSRTWRLVLCKAKINSGTGGLLLKQQYAYGWDEGIGWMDGDVVPTSGKCRGNGGMDGWMYVCMYLLRHSLQLHPAININIDIENLGGGGCSLLAAGFKAELN